MLWERERDSKLCYMFTRTVASRFIETCLTQWPILYNSCNRKQNQLKQSWLLTVSASETKSKHRKTHTIHLIERGDNYMYTCKTACPPIHVRRSISVFNAELLVRLRRGTDSYPISPPPTQPIPIFLCLRSLSTTTMTHIFATSSVATEPSTIYVGRLMEEEEECWSAAHVQVSLPGGSLTNLFFSG